MPLDSKVEDTYNKVLASVIAMDRGNGIILLVDMGSLIFLGDRIQKQTGIKVKTVQNITTLDVLNILRFVLYNDVNIENILEDGTKSYRVISKKKAILTVCTTGIGVAKMAEEMINNLLKENNIRGVEVITSNYDEIREGTEKRNRLMKEYELICSIGDIEPDFDCPYFNISQLVINETKEKIIKLIIIPIYLRLQ
jgi:transcriptional regulatory protein LevR